MHVLSQLESTAKQDLRGHSARRRPPADGLVLLVLLALPLAVTLWGLGYYLAPVSERVRAPLHTLLRASGPIGQGFGILGLVLFMR